MLLHRGQVRRDLEEEMRLHIDLRRQQQIALGLDPEAARHAASRRFGNTTRIKERSMTAWGWNWLETFLQDAAYGIRSMLRTPAITIVALVSLALGIGANTAIFSFIDAVMLRSLPVEQPQQLVKLGVEDWDGITDSFACTELYSYPFYRRFQKENTVFSSTAALFSLVNPVHGFIDNRDQSEPINVQAVSGSYFETLGVGAQLGRVIDENDDSDKGDHPVIVVSNTFWKHKLGGDPSVLNHKLRLGTGVFNIVGVAPPEFFGTSVGNSPDAWAPLSMGESIPPGWKSHGENFFESLWIIGRLKPGVTVEQATANVNVLFPEILRSFPDAKLTQQNLNNLAHAHVQIKSMARGLSDLRRAYSQPLRILMAIVALVLLIACANIANLLLARSSARARELAVRQALGAGRGRILRQLLTESLILALAGGALGIGFAAVANRVLLRMISEGPNTIPLDVSLNLHLLAFTLAVTVATALLFGTLPSFRAIRPELTRSLKSGRGGSAIGGRSPLAKALVIGQVAISLVLMMAAILFLRTLNNLSRANLGFNKQNVLRLDIDSDSKSLKSDDPRLKALFHQIEDRVQGLHGVEAASFSAFTFNEGSWNSKIVVPGMPVDHSVNIQHNIIGNAYFKVMQIPLVAGRSFGAEDTPTSQPVAIISESIARRLFPAGSPIGRTYAIGSPDGMGKQLHVQVIGVAKDVKFDDVAEPEHYIDYLPYSQRDWGFGDFEIRYTGSLSAVSTEVQQAIHEIDPTLPISHVTTLDDQVARSFTDQAIVAELSAFFGIVAVFLSCIGLYGLMSYLVSRRTGEIGIRMALGAGRSEVGWYVMREITLWIFAGIALGIPVTLEGGKLIEKMLYGLRAHDASSLIGAVVVLSLAGLLAGYIPARRATRVNPVVALRCE
ncbi:MAG TPA: ABC transporter permease [Terracidiphilus sp.]|nr:ABC transporter permease [Terracidiphilus sp.]